MTKPVVATLETIIGKVATYFPEAKTDMLRAAYEFAQQAHQGQLRSSGEPYMVHPLAVAQTLADLRLDLASIITGLLHDTVEDTHATLEEIQERFGADVAQLVDGVTKLSKMTFKTSEEKQADNFRKMILAMSKDIRVILVKLADRCNNMQTLQHLPAHKQKLIAQETLDIYAPIANRLGMSAIKIELEDLTLRYLHPDHYEKIAQKVQRTKKEREKYIEEVVGLLEDRLKEYDIQVQVSGRAKHFYSIFRKMERRKVEYEQLFDIIAFRIVVENITECYKSLGVIHATYKPVPGRFKDYIAMPKANAYQSLHTTVIGPHGEKVEIQIRTQEMHQVAEGGIAAHWKYKEGKLQHRSRDNMDWVNRLLEWQHDLTDPNEFLETVKLDLFAEDVFVFTPRGEVKKLPYGSTPLDFAYAVHSNIGHHCVGAKVNEKIVPLKYRLKSGDTVEIITSHTQTPSKDWLKFVKSSRARTRIRGFIKQQESDRSEFLGKELFEKSLNPFGYSSHYVEKSGDFEKLQEHFQIKTKNDFYKAIGYGKVSIQNILRYLIPKELLERKGKSDAASEKQSFLHRIFGRRKISSVQTHAIYVDGLEDILVRFGRCCNPLPGESIVGFITRGKGVTVHVSTCSKALEGEAERKVRVNWNTQHLDHVPRHAKIKVVCLDQTGLLAILSHTISTFGVNIASVHIHTTKDRKAIALFDLVVQTTEQLQNVTRALESQKEVISVLRLKS